MIMTVMIMMLGQLDGKNNGSIMEKVIKITSEGGRLVKQRKWRLRLQQHIIDNNKQHQCQRQQDKQ